MTTPPERNARAMPADLRSKPFSETVRWLAENGEPLDPRTDVDTASLTRRFPHLAHVETTDLVIDRPRGRVPARRYVDPRASRTGRALVWVHGGAFVGGHLDMPEANWVAQELAARGTPVVSVDYAKCLGQTHHPVPSDDVLAAWRFVAADAHGLLGVPPSALHLGGASAGSTLASGVVARLATAGDAPPAGVVLVYPLLHPYPPGMAADRGRDTVQGQMTANYAGTAEALADPEVFVGLGDGAAFPPTLVVVCEVDDLRPSGEAFVATLEAAGRDVTRHLEPGARHGHIDQPGDPGAVRTIEVVADWIARTP